MCPSSVSQGGDVFNNGVFPYGDLRRMANRVVAQGPGIQVGTIVMRYHNHQVENIRLSQCTYRVPNEGPWGRLRSLNRKQSEPFQTWIYTCV